MALVAGRQTATGTILGRVPAVGRGAASVVYARVSSADQRACLDRQVARVTGWLTGQGPTVTGVVREAGFGLNGRRTKLRRVLPDHCATVIVMERRCRLDGRRGARNRAVRAVTAAKNAEMDAAA